MLTVKFEDINGLVVFTGTAVPKEFKTGSRGFSLSQKMVINGKKYQIGLNVIEIGSKAAALSSTKPAEEV